MSEFWFALFWAITGGVLAVLGTLPFQLSGRDSEDERRRAARERCMDAMQERLEGRVREHGRQRYLQGREDERGTGRFVYLDDTPVLTAEQYGAMLDEEEAG